MLLIGIDEAGYGPVLGPLCHGVAVFRVPDEASAPDLWARLAPAVARHPAPEGAVPVDDSKKIYSGVRKLERLAAAVQAFRNGECAESAPLEVLLPEGDRADLTRDAWGALYADERSNGNGTTGTNGALRERLRATGTELLSCHARTISARGFNAQLACGLNKADINAARVGELLCAAAALAHPGEPVHVVVDRLGGRKFYAPLLSTWFGGILVETHAESNGSSRYRFEHAGCRIEAEFRERADTHALPVALASMAAKLAREWAMARFNAYFFGHDAGLRPTAGYYTDAQRFLRETQALRARLQIVDEALIRRA